MRPPSGGPAAQDSPHHSRAGRRPTWLMQSTGLRKAQLSRRSSAPSACRRLALRAESAPANSQRNGAATESMTSRRATPRDSSTGTFRLTQSSRVSWKPRGGRHRLHQGTRSCPLLLPGPVVAARPSPSAALARADLSSPEPLVLPSPTCEGRREAPGGDLGLSCAQGHLYGL